MEKYLRAFKIAGNRQRNSNNIIGQELEDQAMISLIEEVGARLGINSYSLFRNQHYWYAKKDDKYNSKTRWGVDDVFEAELQTFLNAAIEKATGGQVAGDAKSIGNLPGNISRELMQELANGGGQKIVSNPALSSDLITEPIFRSGKVDVSSFTAQVTADMKPFWQEFVRAFSGARFTLKNYRGDSKVQTIHLGKTNITKSLMGTLNELVQDSKEAVHIYYHSLYFADIKHDMKVGEHILHLRFSYELTGDGLYDEHKNKIDAADFFIYNDSTSDNIWVRSTKEMIANALDYMGEVEDPIRSQVVILKNSFH